MEKAAIVFVQIVICMIYYSLRKGGMLQDFKKIALALFGLEIMLVPGVLAISEVAEITMLEPITALILFVVMCIGFVLFKRSVA